MTKEEFIEQLNIINVKISEKQLKQLEDYYNLLIQWNKVMNLTAITTKEEIYLKHFYDSLTITKVINLHDIDNLCDVGSGAGFPGIVLKIMYPHLKITLIDSLNKRIKFLDEVIKKLQLKNIQTIHTRIEEYGINNREKFDIVVARAVASLNILLEYCIPITKIDGYFIAMKANSNEEIKNSIQSLKILDAQIVNQTVFNLPKEDSLRTIIKIKKNKKTKNKYPRKYSEIKNKPL